MIKFIDNTLSFIEIRENAHLFANMNGFFNLVQKSSYIMALECKQRLFQSHINHVKNFNCGRIYMTYQPSTYKFFDKISVNVLFNIVELLSWKECFSKFRGLSRKFNQCFDIYSLKQASDISKNLNVYSD